MTEKKEEKVQFQLSSRWQNTGLYEAIQADDAKAIAQIFRDPKKIQQLNRYCDGLSPLMLAVCLNKIEAVRCLLSLGADPCVMNRQKQTASRLIANINKQNSRQFAQVCLLLSDAESEKRRKIRVAIDADDLAAVKACFPNGKQTDLVCALIKKREMKEEYTPLQYAVIMKGNPDIVDYLLSITDGLRGSQRNHPFLLTESVKVVVPNWKKQKNYQRIIESLKKALIKSELRYAVTNADLDALRTIFGPEDPSKGSITKEQQENRRNFLNEGINTDNSCTPLEIAAAWGQLDRVVYLLAIGADVTVKDISGLTAFQKVKTKKGISPELKALYADILEKINPIKDAKAFMTQLQARQQMLLNIKKTDFDNLPYNESEQNLINLEALLYNFKEENKKLVLLEQCSERSQEIVKMAQQNKEAIKEIRLEILELQNKIQASKEEIKEIKPEKREPSALPASPAPRLEPVVCHLVEDKKSWWENPLAIWRGWTSTKPTASPEPLPPQRNILRPKEKVSNGIN